MDALQSSDIPAALSDTLPVPGPLASTLCGFSPPSPACIGGVRTSGCTPELWKRVRSSPELQEAHPRGGLAFGSPPSTDRQTAELRGIYWGLQTAGTQRCCGAAGPFPAGAGRLSGTCGPAHGPQR